MFLQGIFPPITTPFYPDGRLYHKKLEHNVDRYSRSPLPGIVVMGSTGEAILLSDEERREVLKSAIGAASAEKVMIAGVGIESAQETIRLAEYAATLGYDAAMVRTPHYYKAQINRPENMLAFYRFVADKSPLPVIIYNFPQATGYNIPAELVIALAEHPNVAAIKESSGDLEKVRAMIEGTRHIKRTAMVTKQQQAVTSRMKDVKPGSEQGMVSVASLGGTATATAIETRTREVGFQVMVGAAQTIAPSFELGAVGAILAFADPAPTACYEIWAAWKDGDIALMKQKQDRIAAAAKRIVGEMTIPGVKYAMDLNGYYGGPVRLPLLPVTAEAKAEIERIMADIRS